MPSSGPECGCFFKREAPLSEYGFSSRSQLTGLLCLSCDWEGSVHVPRPVRGAKKPAAHLPSCHFTPNRFIPRHSHSFVTTSAQKHRKRPAVCCFQIGKQPRAAPTSPSRVLCCGNWSAASGCEQGVPKPHDKRQPCCHTRGYALTSQRHPRAETHNNIRGGRHAPFRVCWRSSYP